MAAGFYVCVCGGVHNDTTSNNCIYLLLHRNLMRHDMVNILVLLDFDILKYRNLFKKCHFSKPEDYLECFGFFCFSA